MSVTPHVRELRAKAVTYGRVIANWGTYAPTMPQLQAMLECVTELEEKVTSAKRGEVSGVSKKPGAMREPNVASSFPPDGVAWNANVNAGSTRPRSKMPERATTPPPPRPTTIPPVSAPRSIDTPTPALLRSRRSR
jgi:hypothetical protein